MKKTILGCALAMLAISAHAKDKLIPLSAEDATALRGKTIAMTTHERPGFGAMTAGKAGFGLFGVAAMFAAGNKLVDDNKIQDPAEVVRSNLAHGLRDAYAAQLLPLDTVVTKAKKAKDIAATHPEADYVLDVRSGGWNYAYFPTKWGTYWVGYSVQAQLVDTKTGRQVSNAACNTNTQQNQHPPSLDQLQSNGAKLLKDVTTALGWNCVQLLAKEQFQLTGDKVAATPTEYIDPLAPVAAAPAVIAVEEQADGAPAATSEAGASPAIAPAAEAAPANQD